MKKATWPSVLVPPKASIKPKGRKLLQILQGECGLVLFYLNPGLSTGLFLSLLMVLMLPLPMSSENISRVSLVTTRGFRGSSHMLNLQVSGTERDIYVAVEHLQMPNISDLHTITENFSKLCSRRDTPTGGCTLSQGAGTYAAHPPLGGISNNESCLDV